MKKVIKEKILEESNYYCDIHPDRECFSQVESVSWYGSKFDLMKAEFHLCDECLTEFYNHIKQKYNAEPQEISL